MTGIDTIAFMRDLDQIRRVRDKSWRQVAQETGLDHNTLSSLKCRGHQPRLDVFIRLARWMNLTPTQAGRWIV